MWTVPEGGATGTRGRRNCKDNGNWCLSPGDPRNVPFQDQKNKEGRGATWRWQLSVLSNKDIKTNTNPQIVTYPYNGILFSNKKNKILSYSTTWMNFQNIMLNRSDQTRNRKRCLIPVTWHAEQTQPTCPYKKHISAHLKAGHGHWL